MGVSVSTLEYCRFLFDTSSSAHKYYKQRVRELRQAAVPFQRWAFDDRGDDADVEDDGQYKLVLNSSLFECIPNTTGLW